MTDQQILEKAIQKAIDGGYPSPNNLWDLYGNEDTWPPKPLLRVDVYQLIFNHDFAKALWGEGKVVLEFKQRKGWEWEIEDGDPFVNNVELQLVPKWQFALMEMVIADDPIQYLGENI